MERHGGERRPDYFPGPSFPPDGGQYHHDDSHLHGGYHQQPDHRHQHPNFNAEQNDSTGYHVNGNSSLPLPVTGQKRPFSHPKGVGSASFAKLYVVGITRTATEQDIKAVFGELGQIIEVVLLKDKRTGLQQECCFVKYATIEQAERVIGAFHSQFTFPGATLPMQVRYAEGERERLGSIGAYIHKLYVGSLNRQASRWEIEEIFSPFGVIQEIFVTRDEFMQNRGFAFVQFSCRDMAIAAIQALHGTYVMRGCEAPLIVRFADPPKKPRFADSRSAPPQANDHSNGHGHMVPNEMHQMKSSDSGSRMAVTSDGTPPAPHTSKAVTETEHNPECDWSEHVSPDGELYYYNCVTCESRWEKPEEYALYEQELDNLEDQQLQQQ